ncbi:MAG: hypothetical protein QOG59_1636, partial [Solirubrobacteraceae bacterium]|nr:hypothetical protein [Solirubrobacteraceae bacterium]
MHGGGRGDQVLIGSGARTYGSAGEPAPVFWRGRVGEAL